MRPSLRRLEKANEELYRPMRLRGNTSYPLLSDAKGQAHFHLSFRRGHIHPGEAEVLYMFTDLVRSPIRHGVGKCDRCSRYYVGERSYTPKRYCGRVCSVPATAEKATRERRGREHQEKLMTTGSFALRTSPRSAARSTPVRCRSESIMDRLCRAIEDTRVDPVPDGSLPRLHSLWRMHRAVCLTVILRKSLKNTVTKRCGEHVGSNR